MAAPATQARRRFLKSLGVGTGTALLTRPGLFAEMLDLRATATAPEGPFYPDRMPLDTD